MSDGTIERVNIASIRFDDDLRPRQGIDAEHVARLRDAYERKEPVPVPVLFRDAEGALWPGDGWHRYAAMIDLGVREADAEVRTGTKAEAMLYAAGANAAHGQPRSKEDLRAAIAVALRGLATKG